MKKKETVRNICIIFGILILAVVLLFFSKDNSKSIDIDTSNIATYKIDYYLQNKDTGEYELLTSKNYSNYVGTEITVFIDEFNGYDFNVNLSTKELTAVLTNDEILRFELYYQFIGE